MSEPQTPVFANADGQTTDALHGGDPGRAATIAAPAQAIAGYEILGELGRGGMGVVYKARQPGLNRLVALKMILHADHASPEERLRFLREAESLAQLKHEHIVQVYEVGEHEGKPFICLEHVAGGSLDQRLQGTPLPPREAAALVEQLADGMQAAHDAGIVHRDLKPANVLLAFSGSPPANAGGDARPFAGGEPLIGASPKITDFGLAKRADAAGLSASGAVLGTPSYMAPEQAKATATVDARTDVYALGAILYECLTGRPPFKAATAMDTILQVLGEEPVAVKQLNATVPRDLETIALKCLQKEPAKRYGSAQNLADDLRRFQAGEPILARPVGVVERAVKWAKRRPALAALLLVTLLGVAGVVWKYLDAEQQKGIAEERRKEAEKQTTVAEGKEKEAQQAADKAKKARDFLASIFKLKDANGRMGALTARQILDDAEKRIPVAFADQPALQADLLATLEDVYAEMTAGAPLAMILEVRGNVELQSSKDAKRKALPNALLHAGDRLQLDGEAQLRLVVLSDLHQEQLKPGKEATVRRRGCEPADAVRERSDDILLPFAQLKKGTFYMGWDGEKKGVETKIKDDFEIALHDVTQGQWQAVMGENPSAYSRFGGNRNIVKNISDEELKLFPVESVSWEDAQRFIKMLNEREKGRGYVYRLPAEAEWEYACRGGADTEEDCSHHFYFAKPTNDLSSEQANFNGAFPAGNAAMGKYLKRPSRVGAYPMNKLGLCDMHGNVWQWCADLWGGEGSGRLYRGGCWNFDGSLCRAAFRRSGTQANRDHFLGFRLARVPVRGQH